MSKFHKWRPLWKNSKETQMFRVILGVRIAPSIQVTKCHRWNMITSWLPSVQLMKQSPVWKLFCPFPVKSLYIVYIKLTIPINIEDLTNISYLCVSYLHIPSHLFLHPGGRDHEHRCRRGGRPHPPQVGGSPLSQVQAPRGRILPGQYLLF